MPTFHRTIHAGSRKNLAKISECPAFDCFIGNEKKRIVTSRICEAQVTRSITMSSSAQP